MKMDGENAEARALCWVVRLRSFPPIWQTVGGMKEQPSRAITHAYRSTGPMETEDDWCGVPIEVLRACVTLLAYVTRRYYEFLR